MRNSEPCFEHMDQLDNCFAFFVLLSWLESVLVFPAEHRVATGLCFNSIKYFFVPSTKYISHVMASSEKHSFLSLSRCYIDNFVKQICSPLRPLKRFKNLFCEETHLENLWRPNFHVVQDELCNIDNLICIYFKTGFIFGFNFIWHHFLIFFNFQFNKSTSSGRERHLSNSTFVFLKFLRIWKYFIYYLGYPI